MLIASFQQKQSVTDNTFYKSLSALKSKTGVVVNAAECKH